MPKVDRSQLEPCFGNPKQPCGIKADPQVKGYDGRWRCLRCNAIHAELVFKEAGNAAPNPGEASKNLGTKSRAGVEEARRFKILSDVAAGRRAMDDPETRRALVQTDVDAAKRRDEEHEAKRQSILKKYGVTR